MSTKIDVSINGDKLSTNSIYTHLFTNPIGLSINVLSHLFPNDNGISGMCSFLFFIYAPDNEKLYRVYKWTMTIERNNTHGVVITFKI